MSPEEGKLLIVHDDPRIQELLGMLLDDYVRLIATTKSEALALVNQLGVLEVKGVLIDGNLTRGAFDGKDGIEINKAIKTVWGDAVRTAGISGTAPVKGADIEHIDLLDTAKIHQAVEKL